MFFWEEKDYIVYGKVKSSWQNTVDYFYFGKKLPQFIVWYISLRYCSWQVNYEQQFSKVGLIVWLLVNWSDKWFLFIFWASLLFGFYNKNEINYVLIGNPNNDSIKFCLGKMPLFVVLIHLCIFLLLSLGRFVYWSVIVFNLLSFRTLLGTWDVL